MIHQYARMRAQALARAHARSGDAAVIFGWLGNNETFDDAIGEFAVDCSDQNLSDFRLLVQASRSGRVQAVVEEADR